MELYCHRSWMLTLQNALTEECKIKKPSSMSFSISEDNESLLLNYRAKNFRANESRAKLVLSYAECSRKSLACKMYEIVNKQYNF